MSSEIYQEIILDHYRKPRNYGVLERPTMKFHDANPLCGDMIEMNLKLNGSNMIDDIRFTGRGCAISQASASMLTELVKGKTIDDIKNMTKEDVVKMLGIELGPVRIKCALLSLKVLKMAVYSYLGSKLSEQEFEE